jgi:mannosyltransferase OCH1-like enzyme
MTLKEYINNYYNYKLKIDNNFTYEKAKEYVINKLIEKNNKKILSFNKLIKYNYDANNMPKIIHLTLKDKHKIVNPVWINCLNNYIKMYPDYKIIIYDDNDILKIINYFDKKNIETILKIKKGAIIADIFRYLILYLRGGYYSDMDCFPVKRIDKLSEIQYHGDVNNNFNICPLKSHLINGEYDFHFNSCNNCKLLGVFSGNKTKFNCKGHRYINKNTNIILCYEFEKTWHTDLLKNNNDKKLWTDNGIGICQWFMGSKPQEKLFLECYKRSIKNINKVNLNDRNNLHFNVINSTGPLFFTKIINKYIKKYSDFKEKLCILPSDYFCCGSGYGGKYVPSTKNKFVEHKFNGSWLK